MLARIQWLRDENRSLRETVESLRAQQLRERVKQAARAPVGRLLRR